MEGIKRITDRINDDVCREIEAIESQARSEAEGIMAPTPSS